MRKTQTTAASSRCSCEQGRKRLCSRGRVGRWVGMRRPALVRSSSCQGRREWVRGWEELEKQEGGWCSLPPRIFPGCLRLGRIQRGAAGLPCRCIPPVPPLLLLLLLLLPQRARLMVLGQKVQQLLQLAPLRG